MGGVAGRRKKGKKRIWQYDMQQPMSTPLKMKRGRALWSGQSGSTRRAGLADWSKQTGGSTAHCSPYLSKQCLCQAGSNNP